MSDCTKEPCCEDIAVKNSQDFMAFINLHIPEEELEKLTRDIPKTGEIKRVRHEYFLFNKHNKSK